MRVDTIEHTCTIGFDTGAELHQFADNMQMLAEGARLCKKKGSSWQGRVCGFYSTALTPIGLCIESEREPGSVQIYPISALEEISE